MVHGHPGRLVSSPLFPPGRRRRDDRLQENPPIDEFYAILKSVAHPHKLTVSLNWINKGHHGGFSLVLFLSKGFHVEIKGYVTIP